MAAMESLAVRTPILVQEAPTRSRSTASGASAALLLLGAGEFASALDLLAGDAPLRKAFGENGYAYVRRNYSWPEIIAKYDRLFRFLAICLKPRSLEGRPQFARLPGTPSTSSDADGLRR